MGRVEGKVAFITGAARGQGRSHALKLAAEGADIIVVDICHNIDSARYDLATAEELAGTAKQIEALDRRVVTAEADVRDADALRAAFEREQPVLDVGAQFRKDHVVEPREVELGVALVGPEDLGRIGKTDS